MLLSTSPPSSTEWSSLWLRPPPPASEPPVHGPSLLPAGPWVGGSSFSRRGGSPPAPHFGWHQQVTQRQVWARGHKSCGLVPPIPRGPSWFGNTVCPWDIPPPGQGVDGAKVQKSPLENCPRKACPWAKQDREGVSAPLLLPVPLVWWSLTTLLLLWPCLGLVPAAALRATLGTAEFQQVRSAPPSGERAPAGRCSRVSGRALLCCPGVAAFSAPSPRPAGEPCPLSSGLFSGFCLHWWALWLVAPVHVPL